LGDTCMKHHRIKAMTLALLSAYYTVPVSQAHAEALILAGAPSPVATAKKTYDIPPGPLTPALNRFARMAGVPLGFEPAATEGLETRGLSGQYSVREGFAELLKGTGLEAVNDQHGGYFLD